MILADSSVWIDHFRKSDSVLGRLLEETMVLTHPFVIGELAAGSLKNRTEILRFLRLLPAATSASHEEILEFVERRRLHGIGLGWIDLHLLASAAISGASLWTRDRRLEEASRKLKLAYEPVLSK